MTLNTTTTKVSYAGTGAQTVFPVTFKFLQNSHVAAILRDASGNETTWVNGTQYTLTGAGDESGGTLTVETVPVDYTPASGETLVIKRMPPETQGSALPLGGAFSSALVEEALDLLTMQVQAHSEEIARAVLLKATSAESGITVPDPEAAKFLRWDALAQNLENAGITGAGSISIPVSLAQGGTSATTAAAARSNLGFDGAGGVIVSGDIGNSEIKTVNVENGAITAEKLATSAKASIGDVKLAYRSTEDPGWEMMDGATIGSAASAAQKKDDGYEALFTHLWDEDASLAVSGGRGASAAADWAADKTIALPSFRGLGPIMLNNSGLPNGVDGTFSTRNLGATGGEEDHALTGTENGPHNHGQTGSTINIGGGGQVGGTGLPHNGANTGSSGDGTPHNNMQPYGVLAMLIFSEV